MNINLAFLLKIKNISHANVVQHELSSFPGKPFDELL